MQAYYDCRMVNKPKKKVGRRKKLKKSQPDFYKVIGTSGGEATRDNHAANYFSKIARLSHVRRRERANGFSPEVQPNSGS